MVKRWKRAFWPQDTACAKALRWEGTQCVHKTDRAGWPEPKRWAGEVDSSLTTQELADRCRELRICAESKEKPLEERSKRWTGQLTPVRTVGE